MRRALLALPLLALPLSLLRAGGEDPPAIAWRTDLNAARAEARERGKPLFLVFRCEP